MVFQVTCKVVASAPTKKGNTKLVCVTPDADSLSIYTTRPLSSDEIQLLSSDFLAVPVRIIAQDAVYLLQEGGVSK